MMEEDSSFEAKYRIYFTGGLFGIFVTVLVKLVSVFE